MDILSINIDSIKCVIALWVIHAMHNMAYGG